MHVGRDLQARHRRGQAELPPRSRRWERRAQDLLRDLNQLLIEAREQASLRDRRGVASTAGPLPPGRAIPIAPNPVCLSGFENRGGVGDEVLDAALALACRLGRAAAIGRGRGALLTLGKVEEVLVGSRALIPNPLLGHPEEIRSLCNPANQEAIVELSKLDGAFVGREDGVLVACGVFLSASSPRTCSLPTGLGTRHVTAAGVAERTGAVTVAVSGTDGVVRVFSEAGLILQMSPPGAGA